MEGPIFATWRDAAWKICKAGGSRGGVIVAMVERKVLDGHKTAVSVIQGASRKLSRLARSSLSAEIQVGTMANEAQEYARLA
eukprot:2482710-Pyramimonas_sp.AAC.1